MSSKNKIKDEMKELYRRPESEPEIKSETNITVIESDRKKRLAEKTESVTKNVKDTGNKIKNGTAEKGKQFGEEMKDFGGELRDETANKAKAAGKDVKELGIKAQTQTAETVKQMGNRAKEFGGNAQKQTEERAKVAGDDLKSLGERFEKQALEATKALGGVAKEKGKEIDRKLRVYEKRFEDRLKVYAERVKDETIDRGKTIGNRIRRENPGKIFAKFRNAANDIEKNLLLHDDEFVEGREDFVKKVNCLLGMQILFTAVIMTPFVFLDSKKEWAKDNIEVLPFICVALLVVYTILAVSKNAKQKPFSYILLLVLSVLMGLVCGMISAAYSTYLILLSILLTAFTFILMGFIIQSIQMDVTKYRSWLIVISVWLCVCGIGFALYSTFNTVSYHYSLISGFASLFFVFAMWFDMQMLQGGHTLELEEGDYVSGVVTLYVDIMFLFIHLLQIAGYMAR